MANSLDFMDNAGFLEIISDDCWTPQDLEVFVAVYHWFLKQNPKEIAFILALLFLGCISKFTLRAQLVNHSSNFYYYRQPGVVHCLPLAALTSNVAGGRPPNVVNPPVQNQQNVVNPPAQNQQLAGVQNPNPEPMLDLETVREELDDLKQTEEGWGYTLTKFRILIRNNKNEVQQELLEQTYNSAQKTINLIADAETEFYTDYDRPDLVTDMENEILRRKRVCHDKVAPLMEKLEEVASNQNLNQPTNLNQEDEQTLFFTKNNLNDQFKNLFSEDDIFNECRKGLEGIDEFEGFNEFSDNLNDDEEVEEVEDDE